MYILRIMPSAALLCGTILYTSNAMAVVDLDKMMSSEEQKKTGISSLSLAQKQALGQWISQKFTPKINEKQPLFLDENINSGAQLKLSDGSLYDIAPADQPKATFWLTPFQVKLEPSGDATYPLKITNLVTGVSVKAKKSG